MDTKIEITCSCGSKSIVNLFPGKKEYACETCGVELFKAHITNGYVYVLSNPTMPGLLKIGYTDREVDERVDELNSTGVPVPFDVEAIFGSPNAYKDEQAIHSILAQHRVAGNREFFSIAVKEAVKCIIDYIGSEPNFLKSPNLLMTEAEKQARREQEMKEREQTEIKDLVSKRDRYINSVPKEMWAGWMELLSLKASLRKFETAEQEKKYQRTFINTLLCDYFHTDQTWLNRLEDILSTEVGQSYQSKNGRSA